MLLRKLEFPLLSCICFVVYALLSVAGNFVFSEAAYAQGVSISPNRIIFDERKKSDRVIVSNPSDAPRTYRIQLLKRRMLEDGKYVDVKEGDEQPGELFSNDLVHFSPRSFTVEPNSSQTVRLRLRMPKDQPDGEYRSHLRVQLLPEASTPSINKEGGLAISIRVNYGITIPIIVRKGELSYEVKVETIDVQKNEKTGENILVSKFSRTGNKSSYGDISVIFKDSAGKESLLKFLPGLSMFHPNNSRIFTIPLDVPEGVSLSNGILKVVYREQEAEGGAVIAESSKTL